ncbi:OLC1v1018567C1 [Oldenlandia corymbosa var. corymbosa]|uniref:OLC1v1018567C1 n=1 Tax=Oldenlandia corymbosa var. corymbosa TaxID=529605 RepID=A0AAV1ECA9_OLDCO|nr:OLC1v1018567C1 [Oldenlandia corymbosa var. corymbosa]
MNSAQGDDANGEKLLFDLNSSPPSEGDENGEKLLFDLNSTPSKSFLLDGERKNNHLGTINLNLEQYGNIDVIYLMGDYSDEEFEEGFVGFEEECEEEFEEDFVGDNFEEDLEEDVKGDQQVFGVHLEEQLEQETNDNNLEEQQAMFYGDYAMCGYSFNS